MDKKVVYINQVEWFVDTDKVVIQLQWDNHSDGCLYQTLQTKTFPSRYGALRYMDGVIARSSYKVVGKDKLKGLRREAQKS